MRSRHLVIALALAGLFTHAPAQGAGEQTLAELQALNQRQLEEASLALRRSGTPEIKGLAQAMRINHELLKQRLDGLVRQQGPVDAPTASSAPERAFEKLHADRLESLKRLSGEPFDREFLSFAPTLQRHALATVVDARRRASDPRLDDALRRAEWMLARQAEQAEQALRRLDGES